MTKNQKLSNIVGSTEEGSAQERLSLLCRGSKRAHWSVTESKIPSRSLRLRVVGFFCTGFSVNTVCSRDSLVALARHHCHLLGGPCAPSEFDVCLVWSFHTFKEWACWSVAWARRTLCPPLSSLFGSISLIGLPRCGTMFKNGYSSIFVCPRETPCNLSVLSAW